MSNVKPSRPSEVEFDAELGELEVEQGLPRPASGFSQIDMPTTTSTSPGASSEKEAIPLTLGLAIHSLADGFALGVSFFPASNESTDSKLSFIVFLAIIIHKCEYFI